MPCLLSPSNCFRSCSGDKGHFSGSFCAASVLEASQWLLLATCTNCGLETALMSTRSASNRPAVKNEIRSRQATFIPILYPICTRRKKPPVLKRTGGFLMPKGGLEPPRGCPQRFLRPPRLPFRHFGAGQKDYSAPGSVCQHFRMVKNSKRKRLGLMWHSGGFAFALHEARVRPICAC